MKKKLLYALMFLTASCGLFGCTTSESTQTEAAVIEIQEYTTTEESTINTTEATKKNAETSEETTSEPRVENVNIAGQEYSINADDITIRTYGDGTDISNIKYLQGLRKLTLLNAEEGYSSALGFNNVSCLNELEELIINGVYVNESDFASISNCTNIKKLHIEFSTVNDISCIEQLDKIEELYLSNVNISDITPIASLTNLKRLSIIESAVTEFDPIYKLDNLEYAYISCNNINDEIINEINEHLVNCEVK